MIRCQTKRLSPEITSETDRARQKIALSGQNCKADRRAEPIRHQRGMGEIPVVFYFESRINEAPGTPVPILADVPEANVRNRTGQNKI